MKQCSHCKIDLDDVWFRRRRDRDQLLTVCIPCERDKMFEYREKHRAELARKQRELYHKLKRMFG